MASAAPVRLPSLRPEDWLKAAFARLSDIGIDGVRVELLARDLGATKGSFYWHFRDRHDLLEKMLSRWESDEIGSPDSDDHNTNAASRWARFVQRTANPKRIRMEVAVRAWARTDERVARRVAAVERGKTAVIAGVLREVGFAPSATEEWAETAWLVCLGWLDRAARNRDFLEAGRGLGEFLSDVILAASSRSPDGRRRRS